MSRYTSPSLSSTPVAIKTGAGRILSLSVFNPGAADAYVQVFDVVAASVTVGTTAPNCRLWVPAYAAREVNFEPSSGGFVGRGLTFDAAISIAATTTAGGATAPATALVVEYMEYS